MKLCRQISLILLFLVALPSFSLGQTTNHHRDAKKFQKASASSSPLSTTPLRLSTFTSPAVFASFAPERADLLVVAQPDKLARYSIIKSQYQIFTPLRGDAFKSAKPLDADEIELVMVAARYKPLVESMSEASRQAFERISAELNGREHDSKFEPANLYLAKNLSALVRFKSPTNWAYVQHQLGYNLGAAAKGDLRKWRGHEILVLADNDPSSVLRLDDRTFLLCDRNRIAEQLTKPTNVQSDVGKWLEKFGLEKNGELFVASKPELGMFPLGLFLPPSDALKHLGEVRLSLDVKNRRLLNIDCEFASSKHAESFLGEIRKSLSSIKEMFDMTKNNSADGPAAKLTRLGLDSIDGTKISTTGSTFNLQFVKPDNFEERYMDLMNPKNSRVRRFEPPNQNRIKTKPVAIATRRIKVGERLTKADVKIEKWPEEVVPKNIAGDQKSVVGKQARRAYQKGMPFHLSGLED